MSTRKPVPIDDAFEAELGAMVRAMNTGELPPAGASYYMRVKKLAEMHWVEKSSLPGEENHERREHTGVRQELARVEQAAKGLAIAGKWRRGAEFPEKAWPTEKNPPNPPNPPPQAGCPRYPAGDWRTGARATDEALAIRASVARTLNERSGELIRVAGGRIEPVADDWLLDRFDRTINFVAVRDGQEHLKDAPAWLAERINAKKGERGLPELRAVITAPTIRDDGTRRLDKPGFDTATGLLLTKDTWPAVPANPTFPDLKTAAKTLWSPSPNSPSSTPRRAACT